MRVETLEAYNIASDILGIWRQTVGAELLPVQERAVKEFGLFADGNLIVFSPTSSGKTFVGEMAAVKAARENTKVFYLVPQKALADKKFQEFRERYSKAGIKVVVSSRDHREFDEDIERRDFQIAVVVFEKMQALLVNKPQLMESVGLVVVDEHQITRDDRRSAFRFDRRCIRERFSPRENRFGVWLWLAGDTWVTFGACLRPVSFPCNPLILYGVRLGAVMARDFKSNHP
ncbi:MAG: DEAD/DEAH box helicase [Myxococcaceae bacterium]